MHRNGQNEEKNIKIKMEKYIWNKKKLNKKPQSRATGTTAATAGNS